MSSPLLGRKRFDMTGNDFNPQRIENLKPLWNDIKHKAKTVKGHPIGTDEKELISFFKRNNIPFTFIGNSGLHIKHYFPDFISKDNSTFLEFIADSNEEKSKRAKTYSSAGFKTIFIPTNWIRRKQTFRILKHLSENGFVIKNINFALRKCNKKFIPWNKGKKLHYQVWNKGLTKINDNRVMQTSLKMIGNKNYRGGKQNVEQKK
jgi:hypothetical protein